MVEKGSGNIYVNGIKMSEYFKRPVHQIIVTRPLELTKSLSNYDVRCSVTGGGLSGQAGAIILGISRALIMFEQELKKSLKKEKLTTRDSRVVERKNTDTEKQEEAFSFLKDKSFKFYIFNISGIRDYVFKKNKCSCCRRDWLCGIRFSLSFI